MFTIIIMLYIIVIMTNCILDGVCTQSLDHGRLWLVKALQARGDCVVGEAEAVAVAG